MKRVTHSKRLEWLLTHIDMPPKKVAEKYAKATNPLYETLQVLLSHYRVMTDGKARLLELYNTALAKEEAHAAKVREEKRKVRKVKIDLEMAYKIIDEFLKKWDGRDPMSAGSLG